MAGTSAALTRAESLSYQKAIDLTPSGGKQSGLKSHGDATDPELCGNQTKANPISSSKKRS